MEMPKEFFFFYFLWLNLGLDFGKCELKLLMSFLLGTSSDGQMIGTNNNKRTLAFGTIFWNLTVPFWNSNADPKGTYFAERFLLVCDVYHLSGYQIYILG